MAEPGLDHIGIAVKSIAEGASFYEALGLEMTEIEEVFEQGVRVGFVPVGATRIELLEPIDEASPIARHLERRGPGLHHLCFYVADIVVAMESLRTAGYELLSDEPQPGAHGCRVCFVHPRSGGGVLIELSQPPAGV
jgi:methylmalonyl-CoA/ethylmalonyl-CoA epimerase